MQRSTLLMVLLSVTASGLVIAQQQPSVTVPAPIQADLKLKVGQWTLEDTAVTNGTSRQVDTGTMECKTAAGGIGVLCVEQDTGTGGPSHHRVDMFGYDPSTHSERLSVLEDDGEQHSFATPSHGDASTVHLKAVQPDGKPVAITVSTKTVSNDEMRSRNTVEIGGVTVQDTTRTYRRVK